ncbi:MAG: zf-HC2 domain-containing protein [Acidobacteriales bacterium]|nr:zf-HC2 domain-containing protein [Terriglobales bacterium]
MVRCKTIIANLSTYLDEECSPELRRKIEHHLSRCRRCSAVFDTTRKMLVITGDARVFEVPVGFSDRLHRFLSATLASA